MSHIDIAKIKAMRLDHKSIREISLAVGCNEATVDRHLKALGMTKKYARVVDEDIQRQRWALALP
jgi:hypothetical protein